MTTTDPHIATARKAQLGRNIERLMDARRMTYQEMARLVGVSKSALFKIVDGKVSPKVCTLWAICDVFNCTLDSLFIPEVPNRLSVILPMERRG